MQNRKIAITLAALLLSSAAQAFDGVPVTRMPPDNMPVIGRPYRPGTDGVPPAPKVPPAALCACPIPLASADAKIESTLVPRQITVERIRDSVPLLPYRNGNAIRVEVMVGGERLLMLFDTGATVSQIPKGLAERLITAGKAWSSGTTRVLMANGSIHTTELLTIDSLVIGRHTVRNVRATVASEPLLGFPVVDGIAPFTIDTRQAQLIFHP